MGQALRHEVAHNNAYSEAFYQLDQTEALMLQKILEREAELLRWKLKIWKKMPPPSYSHSYTHYPGFGENLYLMTLAEKFNLVSQRSQVQHGPTRKTIRLMADEEVIMEEQVKSVRKRIFEDMKKESLESKVVQQEDLI